METHRIKSLSTDKRSKNRLRFATNKQKSKRASADVYRRYKRRIGVTSSATREENVHHQKSSKRSRLNEEGRLKSADIDDDNDVVSDETTLATELDLANDRNASEIFGQFYRETWPLVRSLPELIHHAEKVMDIFLCYLLSPEDAAGQKTAETRTSPDDETSTKNHNFIRRFQVNHATTEILHLLSVLAKDLRHEVHPWLHTRILPRIFNDLLNPPLPESGKQQIPLDVTVIEAAFRAVAYLFRYDAEALLTETSSSASNNNKKEEQPCLEPMRRYYGYTLANKRPLIRRLAAETFAPLIRKLKSESSKKRHLRRVLRALDASSRQPKSPARQKQNDDAVDGIAMLCLELSKGISGSMNSKGNFVLDCLFGCIANDKQEEISLSCEVASKMMEELLKTLSTENAAKILVRVQSQIHTLLQNEELLTDGIGPLLSFLRLAREITQFGDGKIAREVTAQDAVLATVSEVGKFLQSSNVLDTKCQQSMASFTRVAWEVFQNDTGAVSTIRKTLARMLGLAGNDQSSESQTMDDFASSFCTCVSTEIFAKLPLDFGLKHVGSLLLKVAAKSPTNSCLTLVHGLAACQSMDPDRKPGADDDTFLPEKAEVCGIPAAVATRILDKAMLPLEELQKDLKMFVYAAKCVAFASLSNDDPNESLRLAKKSTKWLGSVLSSNVWTASNLSTEMLLVFSTCIEALSRLVLIAKERSIQIDTMTDLLTQQRDVCHRALLSNPSSISFLKATSLYCRALQTASKVLVDDTNAVFDVLVPNLRSNVHFIRKHSLVILNSFPRKPFVTDHADLDLSEDLDEEPTNAGGARHAPKGPVGPCDVLETLLKVESLPVEMVSERPLLSLLSRVEIFARSGKLPIVYAEATVAHLLGMLYVKFSPVWPAAVKTLAAVVEHHKNVAWGLIFSRLESLMESCSPAWDKHLEGPVDSSHLNFNIDFHFDALRDWERSGGTSWTLFFESIQMSNEKGKVSNFEYREKSAVLKSVWELFEAEPELIVSHSRDIVPLVIRFFRFHFFSESDPDGQEIFHNDDEDEKAMAWR